MSLKLAFIGFGEVGQLFTRQFAAKRGVEVAVYDILFENADVAPELKRLAGRNGVRAAQSNADACRDGAMVISAVTADAAIDAARQTAPSLGRGQTYIDLNSVSPSTKRAVAREAQRNGAAFVEFAVMSAVESVGIAAPILAGGVTAESVAATLNALGMKITPVAAEIGVASATKLCRSIVIKGMEALMVDLNLAAAEAGVMPAVLASLTATYPGLDWSELARVMPERVSKHGLRRAAEMREAARMLTEMGVDGALEAAIAERQESYARRMKD